MSFLLFLGWLILIRVLELLWSARNERWLLRHGAIQYGKGHYPLIVVLHTCFILSLPLEYYLRGATGTLAPLWLAFFLLLSVLKGIVIATLGYYWNTKIYRVPGTAPLRKGIYRYIRHPNYIIVVLEFIAIPLCFHLYATALIFSVLNALVLQLRIREENRALQL